ncbi:MAG TPA: 5'-nucleotidase [Armatimonadota bacterium]|jgi:2',3'-cyclic-nucleotide 2'-phosphodiesterase (5'-nucleotidase family)
MKTYVRIILTVLVLGAVMSMGWAQGTGEVFTTLGGDRIETSFGDLAADALCASANTTVALVPAVSFKPGTIPAPGASLAQFSSLLQTPDESWAVSSLTGAQLRRALERSLSRAPLPNTAFLQVSGLTLTYNAAQPRDQRIVALTGAQGPIEPDQTYEVVMPLFLAQGGSGYFQIFDKESIVRRGTQGLGAAIAQFRQANPDRTYTGQGRIVPGS